MNSFCQWSINMKATQTYIIHHKSHENDDSVACGNYWCHLILGLSLHAGRPKKKLVLSRNRTSSNTELPSSLQVLNIHVDVLGLGAFNFFWSRCLSRSLWKWLAPECVPSTAAMQNYFRWAWAGWMDDSTYSTNPRHRRHPRIFFSGLKRGRLLQ